MLLVDGSVLGAMVDLIHAIVEFLNLFFAGVLVATGHAPQQLLHWFYGAATLLALPVAMLIGKRLGGREEQVWLAGGAVLTVLFALRAMATG